MTDQLDRRIRALVAEWVEDPPPAPPPPMWAVVHRLEGAAATRPRPVGWRVAAGAAAAVILIVGGALWLVRGGTTEEIGDTPPPTTTISPSTSAVPTTAGPPPSTTAPSTTSAPATTTSLGDGGRVELPAGWQRLPLDPGTFGAAGVWDVASAPDGLIAVGTSLATCEWPGRMVNGIDTSCVARIWASPGGTAWVAVELDDSLTRGTTLWSVAGRPQGLVAVGWDMADETPAVWSSPDGAAWTRVDDPAFDAEHRLSDVAATAFGFVIVGDDGGDDPAPASWMSPDGISWTRIPIAENDAGRATMQAVAASPDLVVAAGSLHEDPSHLAVWTSIDATDWTLIEVPIPEADEIDVADVAVGPGGILVAGYDWAAHSADLDSWSVVAFNTLETGGPCDGDGLEVLETAWASSGFIAVGYRCEFTGMVGAVWVSADGREWSLATDRSDMFSGGMTALQPIPDGTIMFGLDGLEPEGPEDPTSARTVLWLHESPG